MGGSDSLERNLLGTILLVGSLEDSQVQPDDFLDPRNRKIYEALRHMADAEIPISSPTLIDVLQRHKAIRLAGGITYVSELGDHAVSGSQLAYFSQRVHGLGVCRRLMTLGVEIQERAGAPEVDHLSLLNEVETRFLALNGHAQPKKFMWAHQSSTEFLKHLEDVMSAGSSGIPTGYKELDLRTGGFHTGDLTILAGRPGSGKSALALGIAEHIAIEQKKPVAFFSLEMSSLQLQYRLWAGRSGVELAKMLRGQITPSEMTKIAGASGAIFDSKLAFDDSSGLTPAELRSRVRRIARDCSEPIALVIVDYLQLMKPGSKKGSREQEVSEISGALKTIAKDLAVPVLALSQLNRQVEDRSPPIPRLSDLRESGSIEADADVVQLVYRPDYYQPDPSQHDGRALIYIAKQRNGPLGIAELEFIPFTTRFINKSLIGKW